MKIVKEECKISEVMWVEGESERKGTEQGSE
jgi:hypothetical protein